MNKLFLVVLILFLAACQSADQAPPADAAPQTTDQVQPAQAQPPQTEADPLDTVLSIQPEESKARYAHRHPRETLEFFGIEPGMTVLEGLPGTGWYSRILLPYLGDEGHLIGANYALDMWPNFPFANEEFMANTSQWLETWPTQAAEWAGESNTPVSAFWLGSLPEELAGTADAAFFPRVLHNLARFQNEGVGNYLDAALADVYTVLKPGGVFGIVQHCAPSEMPDEWANGSNGYLKKQFVIAQIEAAGFEFVGESDINANPKDQPTEQDIVWRLPPSYFTSRDDPDLHAQYAAIGESNRMTLKFRKPE